MSQFVICALYKFVELKDYKNIQAPLTALMDEHEVRGTLLLAQEGINGTVAAKRESIDTLLAYLNADPRLAGINFKESFSDEQPFNRTKVKLKKKSSPWALKALILVMWSVPT